jgi:hypothetical protein
MFNTVKKLTYTSVAQISGVHTSERKNQRPIEAIAGGQLGPI